MRSVMQSSSETVDVAASKAGPRWRLIALGLALVLATNVVNAAMNFASLRQGPPMVCVAAINAPELAEQAVEQRVDGRGQGFRIP